MIAYSYKGEIWLADYDGKEEPLRLTTNEVRDDSSVWSPDGEWIAFISFYEPVRNRFKEFYPTGHFIHL